MESPCRCGRWVVFDEPVFRNVPGFSKMQSLRRGVVPLSKCLLLWLAGAALLWAQDHDAERLHRLFRETREEQMADSPELATYRGDTRFNDRWTDFTPAAIERRKQRRKERWAALSAIDRSRLTEQDQLNYDLFGADLREAIARDGFPGHLMVMDPLFAGPHIAVTSVLAGMPVRTAGDYANYLARLRAVPKLLEQTIALLEEGRRTGVTQPRLVMRDVPAQLDRLTAGPPEDSPFLVAFRRFPASVPESERTRLRREAASVVDSEVFAAACETIWRRRTSRPPGSRLHALICRMENSGMPSTCGSTPQPLRRCGRSTNWECGR